jgi:phosphatidylinositol N-acetylglucosaminyltransferase subunit Q
MGSQGKRYNVLRDRVDSWDYSIDQLVLGTMLFTLIAFLAPTIIVYYALFALVSSFVRHNSSAC